MLNFSVQLPFRYLMAPGFEVMEINMTVLGDGLHREILLVILMEILLNIVLIMMLVVEKALV